MFETYGQVSRVRRTPGEAAEPAPILAATGFVGVIEMSCGAFYARRTARGQIHKVLGAPTREYDTLPALRWESVPYASPMRKGATMLIVDLGLLVGVALALQGADRRGPVTGKVVFVCEHGAAKSVVAAAHFNQLAEERRLAYRAVAKGTDPQQALSPTAVDGLRGDGLEGAPATPERVK